MTMRVHMLMMTTDNDVASKFKLTIRIRPNSRPPVRHSPSYKVSQLS